MTDIGEIQFSGLSEEAFMGGSEVVESFKRLAPAAQAEAAPHIIRGISYEIPLASLDTAQLEGVAEAAEEVARRARQQHDTIIKRLGAPEHIDLDY
jgi:hypothetical protein